MAEVEGEHGRYTLNTGEQTEEEQQVEEVEEAIEVVMGVDEDAAKTVGSAADEQSGGDWREVVAAKSAAAAGAGKSSGGRVSLHSARVRLTDPEGFMVSTELISTLVARLPSLEAL